MVCPPALGASYGTNNYVTSSHMSMLSGREWFMLMFHPPPPVSSEQSSPQKKKAKKGSEQECPTPFGTQLIRYLDPVPLGPKKLPSKRKCSLTRHSLAVNRRWLSPSRITLALKQVSRGRAATHNVRIVQPGAGRRHTN